MSEPSLDALTRRLDRLERENRWLKRIATVILLGAAAGALMGQARTTAGTLEAQRIIVRDTSGNPRAVLGAAAEGSFLDLYDKEGERRAGLGIAKDGTVIFTLSAKGGKGAVGLSAGPYGWSNLQFYDRDGTARLGTGLTADGSAALIVNDSNGTTRAGLGMAVDGRPFRFP